MTDKEQYILDNVDRAIEKGWVEIYYMPVIRTLTNSLSSFEALARWNDPEYGMLSPAEFIPLLEENDLCYMVDMHVLDGVCSMLKEEKERGTELVPVSVNISRKDMNFDLPDRISRITEKYSVDPHYICIEVTESAVMEDVGRAQKIIKAIRNRGFQVWMDDFGSAYSSLSALSKFRFDVVKMDREFLKDLSTESRTIISSAVHMLKNLGLHTLCEGVETEEQLNFLRDIGCEKVQGYYFSEPSPLGQQQKIINILGYGVESAHEAMIMDNIGNLHFSSFDLRIIAVIENGRYKRLFLTNAFRNILGISETQIISNFDAFRNGTPFSRDIDKLIVRTASARRDIRTVIQMDTSNYLFNSTLAFSIDGEDVVEVEGIDVTSIGSLSRYEYLNYCAAEGYDTIYLFDPDNRKYEVVHSAIRSECQGDIISVDDSEMFRRIHPDDKKRLSKILYERDSAEILANMKRGSYTTILRYEEEEGDQLWIACTIIEVLIDDDHRMLMCAKPSAVSDYSEREHVILTLDDAKIPYELDIAEDHRMDEYNKALDDLRTQNKLEMDSIDKKNLEIKHLELENVTDHLTGVYNRRFFEREMMDRKVQAIAFVDFDDFKKVNDVYGHRAGDIILKRVASTIKSSLRSEDIICRYGGDEFIIIFERITGGVLKKRLEEVVDNVRQLSFDDDVEPDVRMTVSIGACCRNDLVGSMIEEADRNMYRSKKRGKGNVTVTY